MATAQSTVARSTPRQSSTGVLGFLIKALFWLMFSLLISIVIEWAGMTWWWPEQGAQHGIDMYERESAYVFHLAKAATAPMLVMTWAIYLSMPFSIHPSIVILPFAVLFAIFVRVTAGSFKKYL